MPGLLVGEALDQKWDAADLLVLPSRVETYGLVVTEALARGIPAVVSAGTGAVEALEQGASHCTRSEFGPGAGGATPGAASCRRSSGLAAVLRSWLSEPALRAHGGRRRSCGEILCPDGSRRQRRWWPIWIARRSHR